MYRYYLLILIVVSYFAFETLIFNINGNQSTKLYIDNSSNLILAKEIEPPMSVSISSLGKPKVITPAAVVDKQKKILITNTSNLLNEVNKWRTNHNLPSINKSSIICEFTDNRIKELIATGNLDNHIGFNKYIETHSLSSMHLSAAAENLAIGTNSVTKIVEMWENSPPHRNQLLANKDITVGCAVVNNKIAVLIGGY
mgnify:CR=1 FL=1